MNNDINNEITPPWIKFPGFPPGDFLWREAGQPWLIYVWEPFWQKLSEAEQEAYLIKYEVPDEWKRYYFDKDFKAWLETVDD